MTGYTWWVAAYRSTKPTAATDAWQYSSAGSVSGITGNVDKNYFYKDFLGAEGTIPDGWQKTGSKWYYYQSGKMVKSAWREIAGKSGKFWYYLGADGAMLTGEQVINGKRYYLHEKAAGGLPEGALWVTDKDGEVQV